VTSEWIYVSGNASIDDAGFFPGGRQYSAYAVDSGQGALWLYGGSICT
jgi:hypothetical protein